ncbi:hypothetical protein AAHA92_08792 [Salvia divinorum]|uniref:Uncharacterized protein n=1 Tax=Salvia divinorum TaxID=28513 RepID=A0ABD1HSU8_SALDI
MKDEELINHTPSDKKFGEDENKAILDIKPQEQLPHFSTAPLFSDSIAKLIVAISCSLNPLETLRGWRLWLMFLV